MKKKLIALILFLSMLFTPLVAAYNEAGDPATPTDLGPVIYDYTINRSNMPQYSIVAFENASITGHIRGSIYVGGTLTGNQYVDDGSIDGVAASDSYVRINNSSINFKGRTGEQSPTAYRILSENSVYSTAAYWRELITKLPNNDTYVYLEPDANGNVSFGNYEYHAEGSDIAYRTIEKVYWTNATTVTASGIAGHLIAPYATVNIPNCNFCGSIVARNVNCSGEAHINTYVPPTPPEPSPTPTPTPDPVDITINKTLIGSVWHIRCDYMDGITFKAGGGYWRRDWIKNPSGQTSKEGHRSNKCGNADNWVIWVDVNGQPFRMDEIKSGATGGTLPTIIYEPRYQLSATDILAMESGDQDLIWKYSQNFIDVKDWSTIKLGERMYWTTANGNSVWYHTGVPYKAASPTYTIYIDGEGYNLVANEGSVTIEDLEAGIHTIIEEKYGDTYVSAIYVNGIALSEYDGSIEITSDTTITVENTLITPPPTNSPKPPKPPVVPTPTPTPTPEVTSTPTPTPTPEETERIDETPTPTPTPEVEETPTPTPTPEATATPTPEVEKTPTPTPTPEPTATPTPTPTPILYCNFIIKKIVVNYEEMEDTIFFFKITGPDFEEYIEITVNAEEGIGTYSMENLRAGKYTVEEIDIPTDYELISDESITLYIADEAEFVFENRLLPQSTPTPTPESTPTPTPAPSPTPTPTLEPTPTISPTPEPTEMPEGPKVALMVKKVWENDTKDVRPEHITLHLLANGEHYSDIVISEKDDWQLAFWVPQFDEDGEEIRYTWSEMTVPNYHPGKIITSDAVTTITNTYITLPVIPEDQKQPDAPKQQMKKRNTTLAEIDEYDTALGINVIINHVGDCFD